MGARRRRARRRRRRTRATVDADRGRRGQGAARGRPRHAERLRRRHRAGAAETARTFLTSHDGSRSWLVLRGLRELGIPSELRVAENDPFSADPAFPPHFGRFIHPLVVAHVERRRRVDRRGRRRPATAGRARVARAAGAARPGDRRHHRAAAARRQAGDERDEMDVRLDARRAAATRAARFAVVLRGRDAQELAESLVRIVGAERQRALRDVVLAWLPWANVDDVQLASSEGSWQVSLRADVSVSGYAQREGAKTWLLPGLDTLHWSWPRARVSSLGATFATRGGPRERARAEHGGPVPRAPAHRAAQGRHGGAHAGPARREGEARRGLAAHRGRRSGGALEDDFVLGVATGTIPARGLRRLRRRRARRRRRLPRDHARHDAVRTARVRASAPRRAREQDARRGSWRRRGHRCRCRPRRRRGRGRGHDRHVVALRRVFERVLLHDVVGIGIENLGPGEAVGRLGVLAAQDEQDRGVVQRGRLRPVVGAARVVDLRDEIVAELAVRVVRFLAAPGTRSRTAFRTCATGT